MESDKEVIEQPNSVKIAINGKGQFSGEVKAYAETISEALDRAERKADDLQEYLEEKNKPQKIPLREIPR